KGEQRKLRQGQGGGGSGLHTTFTRPVAGATLEFDVEFKSSLQGTETLSIAPLAERNLVALESNWPHPQFHGDFLPRTRVIGPDGFGAPWEVSSLASNAQSHLRERMSGSSAVPGIDAISVSLVDPVNIYSKVDRATKYGVLFVLLTFAAFATFEFLEQLRIHP